MRSLKKNIVYNSIYQFLIMFLPFVTAPYLSRVIGPEGVGTYSYSYSVAQYFVFIAMLGLTNYGNRSIASVNDDKRKRSKVFSEIYCMQIITALSSVIIYLAYVYFTQEGTSAWIQVIYVISALFDITWLFFGTENFGITILRNTLIKVISMISIFIFVEDANDTYLYILIMAASTLVSQIALWPFAKDVVSFTLPQWADIRKHFKPNITLFIPVISISIYKIMGKIMLGQMASAESVGYYEYAEKIYNIPLLLITAVGTVMLPRMTYLYSKDKVSEAKQYFSLSMEFVLMFANAAMFGLMAISTDFVIVYYGMDFQPSTIIINYLSITIIFLAAGNVLRTQYLIPKKLDKIYIYSAVYGAILNFIVNFTLIPRLDILGAVYGTIIAEAVVFLYQLFSVRKEIDIKKIIRTELRYGIIGLIMFLTIFRIQLDNRLITLLVKILLGGGVYSLGAVGIFCFKYKTNPILYLNKKKQDIMENKT